VAIQRPHLRLVPNRQTVEATIQALYAARHRLDYEAFGRCFTDDAQYRLIGNTMLNALCGLRQGREAICRTIAAVDAEFEFSDWMIEDIIIDGDHVAVRWWARILNRKTGLVGEVETFNHIVMRDGLVAEYTQFFDTAGVAILAGQNLGSGPAFGC
jgi:ketosteroid isomerase-like protein